MTRRTIDISQIYGDTEDNRRLLMALFEKCIAGVVVIGDDFRIEYANDTACRITDRDQSELIGNDFRMFLDPQSIATVQAHYTNRRNNLDAPEVYEARAMSRDGQTRALLIKTAIVTGTGGRIKTIAHVLDVTDEKKRMARLQESETRYQTLVESMSDGLGVIDTEGCIGYANAALCRMTGYEQDELMRLHVWDLFQGMSIEAVDVKNRERRQGKNDQYETCIVSKNGACIQVAVSAAPLFGDKGEFRGSIFIARDITEQKRMQSVLQRSEDREREAKEKGMVYLDVMAHDIGNQLQVLRCSVELLQAVNKSESSAQLLNTVVQSLDRCESIVSKARDIEHLMLLPLVKADLVQLLLRSVYRARAEFEGVDLQTQIEVDEAEVMADEFLERLFGIVIENAYVHNPGTDRRIWVGLRGELDGYVITVADNGPGIAKDVKKSLFDSTRRPGGVGLHLAQQIVEKYGGTLAFGDRIEGHPEVGTEFRAWLPSAG